MRLEDRIYIREAKKKLGEVVVVGGWVHEFRNLGKVRFLVLRDWTGKVQVTAKRDVLGEKLDAFKFNREDVVLIKGVVKSNEIAPDGVEIIPEEFITLSKVEKKIPVDPAGVVKSELDTRLNYRYLDTRREEIAAVFRVKSTAANAFRNYLLSKGFIEIHPSVIVAEATEGGAEVFPVDYFGDKAYLAQSPQLYKQMAVVGGLERVFITTPVFRAEKHHTTTHLNEIIQMDVEMAFFNHHMAMDLLEEVFLNILKEVSNDEALEKLGVSVSVPERVERISYDEAVEVLNESGFKMEWGEDFSREGEKKLYELMGEALIVYNWPTDIRAFYSMPEGDGRVCRAYDLIYKGLEVSSGAQRIHIPEVLEKELKRRGLPVESFQFYIEAFRYGAPPHAGWSIGLERLVMQILGLKNIREVMLFPRDRFRVRP